MDDEARGQKVTTVSTEAPARIVKTSTKVSPPPVKTEHPQRVYEKKKTIFRTYQIVWYVLAVIEILLGFRMALKALGANPASGFTSLIYAVTDPLSLPFQGILGTGVAGASVFEWSTIIAAIVYALIAYAIIHLFQFIKPVDPEEVERNVDDP